VPFDASNVESTTNLLQQPPSTPQILIRTLTEPASSLEENDRTPTPHGLSPARSLGRNSDPWQDRSSGQNSPTLWRNQTSSNNSFEADSLKVQIRSARIECPQRSHCYIVPNSALESLITVTNVEKDIRARSHDNELSELDNVAESTCRTARKVFAILACMKKGPEICSLLRDGISDEDLPLTRCKTNGEYMLRRTSGIPIKTFERWNDKDIEKFDRIQWWMLAPVFEDKEHYELDKNIILPFIPFKTNPEMEKKKEGGYSEVWAARLHHAHHKFWEPSKSEVWRYPPCLALA